LFKKKKENEMKPLAATIPPPSEIAPETTIIPLKNDLI